MREINMLFSLVTAEEYKLISATLFGRENRSFYYRKEWNTEMNRRIISFLVVFILCMVSSVGFTANPQIKIGVLLPLSGSYAEYGNEMRRGMEIAVDIMREDGGIQIGGQTYDVNLIFADTPDVQSGMGEAERLITRENAHILCGTFLSSVAMAASTIAERNKVIYWEPGNPADELTQRGLNYFFRTCATGSLEGSQMAQFALENYDTLGRGKPEDVTFAICGVDTTYGTSVLDGAENKIKETGGKLLVREQYATGVTDLSSLVLRIRRANPDVVILAANVDDGMLFYRQVREQAVYIKCMIGTGSSTGAELFYRQFGTDAEYVLSGNHPSELSPEGYAPGLNDFLKRYREKYNREHLFSVHSLATYHGLMVLWDVLGRSESLDTDDIREAAYATDIPVNEIANGWGCKFAPPGDPMQGTNLRAYPVVTQWQDGKMYMVWPIAYPGKNPVLPLPTWEERAEVK